QEYAPGVQKFQFQKTSICSAIALVYTYIIIWLRYHRSRKRKRSGKRSSQRLTMNISGQIYYDGAWRAGEGAGYQASNPATGGDIAPRMSTASKAQVEAAADAAQRAFFSYKNTSPQVRANFLRTCADE